MIDISENVPVALVERDSCYNIRAYNRGFCELTGYEAENMPESFMELVVTGDRLMLTQSLSKQLATGNKARIEYRILRPGGSTVSVLEESRRVLIEEREVHFFCAMTDITEIVAERTRLEQSEERFRTVVEQIGDITFEWDFETDTIIFSERAREILTPITSNILGNKELRGRVHEEEREAFDQWIRRNYKSVNPDIGEFRFRASTGEYIWMRIKGTAICEGRVAVKMVGIYSRIEASARMVQNSTLKRGVSLPLSGRVIDREMTRKLIEQSIQKNAGKSMAAMVIARLQGLENVRERLGVQYFNIIVAKAAYQLKQLFRGSDIIGKLDDGEFIIFLRDIPDEKIALIKAERLAHCLNTLVSKECDNCGGHSYVGVSLYPDHGSTFEGLCESAMQALEEGRDREKDFMMFEIGMSKPRGWSIGNRAVPFAKRVLSEYFAGDPIYNVIALLYETSEPAVSVRNVLGLICRRFALHRAYIYELDGDREHVSVTYEWYDKDIEGLCSTQGSRQHLSLSGMRDKFPDYEREGIFSCADTSVFENDAGKSLNDNGVMAFIRSGIWAGGKFSGLIGFEDLKAAHTWRTEEVATLGYLCRILAVFVMKFRAENKLVAYTKGEGL